MFSFRYHCPDFSLTWLYMSSTAGILQEAGTAYPSRAPKFPPVFFFFVGSVLLILLVYVLSFCVSLRSELCVVMSVTISVYNRCSVRLYLQLFIGGSMSYLRSLCLFAHSVVQPILCCDFALFFFVSCILCCQLLWIVLFWLPFGILERLLIQLDSHPVMWDSYCSFFAFFCSVLQIVVCHLSFIFFHCIYF